MGGTGPHRTEFCLTARALRASQQDNSRRRDVDFQIPRYAHAEMAHTTVQEIMLSDRFEFDPTRIQPSKTQVVNKDGKFEFKCLVHWSLIRLVTNLSLTCDPVVHHDVFLQHKAQHSEFHARPTFQTVPPERCPSLFAS